MAIEKKAAIKIDSGKFAGFIQARALEKGCVVRTVVVKKGKGRREFFQAIAYAAPSDSCLTRWSEGRKLPGLVDAQLRQGRPVMMTLGLLSR